MRTSFIRKWIIVPLCIIIYICLISLSQWLHHQAGFILNVGMLHLPATSINGILSAFMNLICIIIISDRRRVGRHIAYSLMTISICVMIFTVIMSKSLAPLPGIINQLLFLIGLFYVGYQYEVRNKEIVTDPLTGLMNRRGMTELLYEKTGRKEPFYLFYIDMDDFKTINDNLGHHFGDAVLKNIAAKMRENLKSDYHFGRLGGDEFVAFFPASADYERIAKKILADFGDHELIARIPGCPKELAIKASIGIVKYPQDTDVVENIIKYCDIALRQAKKSGGNSFCCFDKTMEDKIKLQAEMELLVRSALKEEQLYLVYQPQFCVDSKKIKGFESLIRLKDTDRSVNIGQFINAAEQSQLIFEIDEFVLNRAVEEFLPIVRNGSKDILLSVNVSAKNICRYEFAEMVQRILEKHAFPAENLEIEITEYCLAHSLENATKNIDKLKKMGVRIALDDFGTGYASLSYLSALDIDLLKIDKSFIDDIAKDEKAANFVQAVITIGHQNGCDVISEGVEQTEQVSILQDYGCDFIQGYVWGRPMPYDNVVDLVAQE